MAFRRTRRFRRYGKKRVARNRRTPRRTGRGVTRPSVYRSLASRNGAHFFKRHFYQSNVTIVTGATGQANGAIYSNGITSMSTTTSAGLISMPNVSEFTNLFDKYRLLGYSIRFIPRYNSVDQATGNALICNYVYDSDDNTVITSLSDLMQYPNVKSVGITSTKGLTLFVKYPCVAPMVYNGLTTTAYAVKRSPWLDLSSAEAPHWGIKLIFTGNASATYVFDIKCSWYFAMKDVR